MKYKGIIFDLDGVICSTDECHYQAWKKLADEIGAAGFNREDNARQRGVSRMESLEVVLEKAPHQYTKEEKAALAEHKNEMYRQLLANMSPADLSHEVKDTLDALRAKGLLLAIGSSSKNAPFILDRIGLGDYFDKISDGNNISHSKPHPEVFLLAAEYLGLAPADCLVVEDAQAGIQAAQAGGMDAASVGPAAKQAVGTYQLETIYDLLALFK